MHFRSRLFTAVIVFFAAIINLHAQDNPVYPDWTVDVDDRVDDLISRMTSGEKISQLGNNASAIPRLNIPAYNYWSEALHGVARAGLATSFPQAIALSSTWNPELVYRVAQAISDEARVKNNTEGKGLTYWSPTINMARDPRWGRAEENYGEDVYLARQIALSFVRGMQGNDSKYLKTVATVKHFAANNIEVNRYSRSSNMDERNLREYYLPVFKACVEEAGVFSVMSAYNAVNDVPCSANRTLLEHILRTEWGFQGYVVSDCDAIYNVWNNHHYVKNAASASAISVISGTDLNCGSTYQENLNSALTQGLLTEAHIDNALHNLLKARFLLGKFDPSSEVVYTAIPDTMLDCRKHRDLALEAARESIVLLKNENQLLPLDINAIDTIAIIGPNADQVQLGGYSGSPAIAVSTLSAVRSKMGLEGAGGKVEAEYYDVMSGIQTETCAEGGLNVGYIENGDYMAYNDLSFDPGMDELDIRVASATAGGNIEVRLDGVNGELITTIAVSGTGGWQNWVTLTADVSGLSGTHDLYLVFTGGSGYLLNVNWFRFYDSTLPVDREKVLYTPGCNISSIISEEELDHAAELAARADVAIVVCGTDLHVADESFDRTDITLPGVQDELIQSVYAANPNTVVVLVTGFSLGVNWPQEHVPAILTAWYNGQSQGTAIADVLFGDYNPAGRLCTTWYKSVEDLPDMDDYNIRNNRTYMYFEGEPLYPFGYGLSYTTFGYDSLKLESAQLNPGDSISMSVQVRNIGTRAGDEVVQFYLHVNSNETIRPKKELKGFQRIHLLPGETRSVTFILKHEDLSFYNTAERAFYVESGMADLLIGSSSDSIHLSTSVTVGGGPVEETYRQDPNSFMEAEFFEGKSQSVQLAPGPDGNQCAEFSQDNTFIMFKNFNFEQEVRSFIIEYAAQETTGTSFSIYLDSLDGEFAGTIDITPKGDLNQYGITTSSVGPVDGLHDVYLVYHSSAANTCRVNWFRFSEETGAGDLTAGYKKEEQFRLFPNPAGNQFNIEYYLSEQSDVTVEIFSIDGKKLSQSVFPDVSPGFDKLVLSTESTIFETGLHLVKFNTISCSKMFLLEVSKN
ncbi:MAG: glycoside hydrolase family 3 C-terminal domain-containing protein [Bacteroidales bacterium]|nr:glycoside hydrolase family 3 C-terminal domain-containing protein [Bacteroidales bacterium]MBN2698510.1 glycoside hydrolase family 3 C-terminal domain-containing protein [Bacteroidales bacterium]